MLGMLNQNRIAQTVTPIKNAVNTMQAIGNNPLVKKAMAYIQESGGDPKKAFYKLAEDNGLNAEMIDSLNDIR